ncbi:alpha/beta hydrolase [Gordonia sp. TBRC 11910]|uniref:Alpha/beta hydrolase n=2 Tax=Gordonia asplenii TaxID=2725283 RepID=A0A848L0P3_9ACTN|nr:alpha/beta hydrolase [Gordonia asplenii]
MVNGYLSLVAPRAMAAVELIPPAFAPAMVTTLRPAVNSTLVALSPTPRGTTARPVSVSVRGTLPGRPVEHVRGEWVYGPDVERPVDPASASIIYYLHGSGYVVCSPRTHRGLVSRLSQRTSRAVFSLDYRLGPRYHQPAGGDDTIRGYHWLLDLGYRPENIVVAGDSAGGHLALDLLADNHRTGTAQPGGMVLFSPLLDPTFGLAVNRQARGVRDPIIDAAAAARFLELYTGRVQRDDPRVIAPITAGMSLPPTLIQVGAREVMADDARGIYDELRVAGGFVQLQEWPDQGHVFQMFPYLTPESRRAVSEAARFIRGL